MDDTDRLRRLALQGARLSDDLSDEGGEAELVRPGATGEAVPFRHDGTGHLRLFRSDEDGMGRAGRDHVALYIGGGMQIAATHTGDYVRL